MKRGALSSNSNTVIEKHQKQHSHD